MGKEPLKQQTNGDVINAFNKDVFSRQVLRQYLTDAKYREFIDCLENYKVSFPTFLSKSCDHPNLDATSPAGSFDLTSFL